MGRIQLGKQFTAGENEKNAKTFCRVTSCGYPVGSG